MKNTTHEALLPLMLNPTSCPLLPDQEEFISKLLECNPEELRFNDDDGLYDRGMEDRITFVAFGRHLGSSYNWSGEESGLLYTGHIGGVPAVMTKCFGLRTFFIKA